MTDTGDMQIRPPNAALGPQGGRVAGISDKPWGSISESDYTDAAAFCSACLIDLNTGPPSQKSKGNCKLPVREPGGALNRGAVHAAAGRLAQTEAPAPEKAAAARKLVGLYRQLGETAPEVITRMAM